MTEISINCAWCNKPLSNENVELYASGGYQDSFGGASSEADASLEITCDNPDCPKYKKVIYKKEYSSR